MALNRSEMEYETYGICELVWIFHFAFTSFVIMADI